MNTPNSETQQATTAVARYWNAQPCGTAAIDPALYGTSEYFDQIERERYEWGDHLVNHVDLSQWSGKRGLEIGCGVGTDLRRALAAGAVMTGVDLSEESIRQARTALDLHGSSAELLVVDGQDLPFAEESFDFVYSWGVIHHAPNPSAVVREIYRVLKPGGQVIAMLYNRRSLLAFQAWFRYGLLRGHPTSDLKQLIASNIESPETQAYTVDELRLLFGAFSTVSVTPIVTRYDLRLGRRRYLPRQLARCVPRRFGWFLLVHGRRPNT